MGNAASVTEAGRQQGNALYASGDLAGAARIYKRALSVGPEEAHLVHSNLSACYAAAGLFAPALQAADAAVAAAPTWAKGHFRRATVLAQLELWPEAVLALRRAWVREPGSAAVVKLLEECLAKQPAPPQRGNGMTYSWGRGEFGALGHGDVKDRTLPRMIDELRGTRVADIACGIGHTLVVSEAGDVFAWGWNSKGQCGLPDVPGDAVCTPTMLGTLLGQRVRAVACGAAHSLAVTAGGQVLSWGLGGSGQLGHGDLGSTRMPKPIDKLASEAIQGVACGFGHSIVLSRDGHLYSWGWNREGQLGVGDRELRAIPTRLSAGCSFQHIACGGAHSAVVSTTGDIYTFGSGSCGQLGLGKGKVDNALRPTLVEALAAAAGAGVKVALCSCGEEFTLAITANQSVYAFGLGNVGQMGNGVEGNAEAPILIEGMQGKHSEAASCGAAQAHVVSTEGKVWVWGLAGTDTQQMAADLRRAAPPGEHDAASAAVGGRASELAATVPSEVGTLKSKRVTRLDSGRRHFVLLTCPASPLHSRLEVPSAWDEGGAMPQLPAGKRVKIMLHVHDALGRRATQGGERVVGRLLWAGGDEDLPGAAAEADAAADAASAIIKAGPTAASGAGGAGAGLNGAGGGDAERNVRAAAALARTRGIGSVEEEVKAREERRAKAVELAASSTAAALVVNVDDCYDGSYEVTMRPRREGVYSLWVLLNSEHVLGSPRLVHVRASRPSASECMLVALHSDVVAGGGEAAKFELLLRDEFGNELASPPGELLLELSCTKDTSIDAIHGSLSTLEQSIDLLEAPDEANAAAAARARAERRPPAATWVVRDDGVVSIAVRSEVAGCFVLSATLDGAAVRKSPAAFTVAAGPAHAPSCYAHARALQTVVAGRAAALAVRCFDEFGNDACSDADVLLGELRRVGPAPLALQAKLPQVRARPPQPPGTAALMFTPPKAATLELDASINGKRLPGAPFPVQVVPAEAAAIACALQGDGLLGAVVRSEGLRRGLRLSTADVHGNACLSGGANVSLRLRMNESSPLSRPSSARPQSAGRQRGLRGGPLTADGAPAAEQTTLDGTVVDRGDGTYDLEYTALPGEWVVSVLVDGRPVPPTPCSICNVIDPAEEEERRAREEAERRRQQQEAEAAERARRAQAEREAEERRADLRRELEERMIAQARKEDEKQRRADEAARKRAVADDEKRRRVMAALRREEETRRRAEEALAEVQREKERQLAEALRRKQQFSKRTGGGFIVNFKVDAKEEEEVPAGPSGRVEHAWGAGRGAKSRRVELEEAVDDA